MFELTKQQIILVLAPHTDDGEWGAGGSLARWVRQGHEVHYVAFSAAEESVQEKYPPNILRQEVLMATNGLGIARGQTRVLNFKVRHFPRDRQGILEEMVSLRNEIKPTLVLLPSSQDTHQDHEVINREGFRAFKKCNILGYEISWNHRVSCLQFYQVLDESDIACKVESIAAYKSQVFRTQNYEEVAKALAIHRGVQIGQRYAEAYEVIRWVAH